MNAVSNNEILFVGIPNPLDNRSFLLSEDSAALFTDYKIIIIRPVSIVSIIGKGAPSPLHYITLRTRHEEMMGFLSRGGVIVCLLTELDEFDCGKDIGITTNYDFIAHSWGSFYMTLYKKRGRVFPTKLGKQSAFQPVLNKTAESFVYVESVEFDWDRKKVDLKCLAKNSQENWVAFEAKYKGHRGKMVFLPVGRKVDTALILECAKIELLHSTLKCNTVVCDFEGCFEIQALSGPVV